MKSRWILAALVVVAGVVIGTGNVLATPSTGQTTTILAKATIPDLDLRGRMETTVIGPKGKPHPGVWTAKIKTRGSSDAYVVDNKFAANGGTSGWHSHPGPSIVFVVAGTITNYTSDDPSCGPHVYTAGQSFVDPGGDDAHMLRNEDPTVVAETIAVQLIPEAATRRIDEPAPAGCPS